jgi:hypothetical protein
LRWAPGMAQAAYDMARNRLIALTEGRALRWTMGAGHERGPARGNVMARRLGSKIYFLAFTVR